MAEDADPTLDVEAQEHDLLDRERAAYTEHALWELAAERVETVLDEQPHLTAGEVLTHLRQAAASALAEHARLRARRRSPP